MGFKYILLLTTLELPASILLVATQIISPTGTMSHQMKEYSENPGKHHDDDGIIKNDSEENGLEDDGGFDGFHENYDGTSDAD